MDGLMNDYQDGLKLLDDLKDKKREMEGLTNGVTEAESGMNGIMGLTESGKNENGNMGLANGANAADGSSESSTRASDDTYSIGSFFSDLDSFGSDAAEMLEESKKFFTKLGAVVAIIGTCITSAKTLISAIQDEDLKTAVPTGVLLIGIQIPTTLAMLFVFLKEWVKATIAGFFKAKQELEELASDMDSFIDDSESEETVVMAPSNANGQVKLETDQLKSDLERTKRKNNYGSTEELQKCDHVGFSMPMEKKSPSRQNPHNGVFLENDIIRRNGDPDMNLDQRIRKMEEGGKVSGEPENYSKVPRTKRELPRTPSSNNRDRRIHGESRRTSSKPVRTSSRTDSHASLASHTSSKTIESRDRPASKTHSDTRSHGRSESHRSSSRVSSSKRSMSGSSRRSEAPSTIRRSGSSREKSGDHSTKRERSYRGSHTASGRRISDNHRSKGTHYRDSKRLKSEQSAKSKSKKPKPAPQKVQEVWSIEPIRENSCENGREDNNREPPTDRTIKRKWWKFFWRKGRKSNNDEE